MAAKDKTLAKKKLCRVNIYFTCCVIAKVTGSIPFVRKASLMKSPVAFLEIHLLPMFQHQHLTRNSLLGTPAALIVRSSGHYMKPEKL